MIDVRTGKPFAGPSAREQLAGMTRRTFGKGIAACLAAGCAPSIVDAATGLRRGVAMRAGMMAGSDVEPPFPYEGKTALAITVTSSGKYFEYRGNSGAYIDWGDGSITTSASSGTRHTYSSIGDYIIVITSSYIGTLNTSNVIINDVLNCVSTNLANNFFRGDNSSASYDYLKHVRITSPSFGVWSVSVWSALESIDIYNFSNFTNSNDWKFPICPKLERITFHGKTCQEMLSKNYFKLITNCMQTGSTSYVNTKIFCDDGYIQYDIDTYGREDTPVLSHYKTVFY